MLSLRGLPHNPQIHMLELVNIIPIMQRKELGQGLCVACGNLKRRVAELTAEGRLSYPGP